ncbi:family 10 glycosylhydrolase [Rufibacter immobilis]|uniref:family 10 glycosylhydrolase n=1 Tax=Rufibacter immobilis TaxID=1348778 RepID=UPI0035E5C234
MKKHLLGFLLSCLCVTLGFAQNLPKREFRGAWIATYANIDWPNRNQTPQQQQNALISILDHHKATGLNAIFLQVRSQSDALYASTIDPWSADLTATQGKAPSPFWDPLQFAIEECHKRGMELHAWMNPYRAIANVNQLSTFAPSHVARQHPEWLIATANLRTLDPGIPGVRDYINSVITDVVQRYDVDGIHFDDYFYPNAAFNDDATFNADPRGFTNRADWRRDNVNLLIAQTNATVKGLKPWVKFGVSPSGIYRNSTNPAIGTPTSGLEHYTSLYADSKKWLQEGWIDYLAPQVYWFIGQSAANYSVIIPWWNNNAAGRHIYIGMAGYKVNDPAQGTSWANPSQIPNQVRYNRLEAHANIKGQAIYNTSSLRSSTKLGFRDSLRLDLYRKPALQPTMPWIDNTPPAAPTQLLANRVTADSVYLTWSAPAATANEFDKVRQYAVYRSESPVLSTTDVSHLLAITNTNGTTFKDKVPDPGKSYYYVVTALDRFHNESTPSNVTDNFAPTLACVPNQVLNLEANCTATLPDYRSLTTVSDDVSTADALTLTQSPAAGTTVNGVGELVVTLTVTDASGKSTSCSFTVEGKDVTAPAFMLAATQSVNLVAGCEIIVPDLISGLMGTDACGTVTFTQSPAAGEVISSGHGQKHIVTVTAQDANGNTTQKNLTLNAVDATAPVLLVKNITRTLQNGTVTITAAEVNNGSYDNCTLEEESFMLSQSTFTCANIGENQITFTARDNSGNEASATAVVTIVGAVPAPAIGLSRADQTYTGLPANTLALGYGAQTLTLTASNSTSATGQTTYQWSPVLGLSSTTTAVTEFTPTAAGTYTFTVVATNEFGCSESITVTVEVIDVRCGNKNDKVLVCQKIGNGYHALCIAPSAVPAHLRRGSTLGNCNGNAAVAQNEEATEETSTLKAYPNPFTGEVTVSFRLEETEKKVSLEVYDLFGNKVTRLFEGKVSAQQTYEFKANTANWNGNLFHIRLITSSKVYNYKLVRGE